MTFYGQTYWCWHAFFSKLSHYKAFPCGRIKSFVMHTSSLSVPASDQSFLIPQDASFPRSPSFRLEEQQRSTLIAPKKAMFSSWSTGCPFRLTQSKARASVFLLFFWKAELCLYWFFLYSRTLFLISVGLYRCNCYAELSLSLPEM